MKHFKDIFRDNAGIISFYIVIGIVIAFLNSFSISLFQNVIDNFSNGTLSLPAILWYGLILLLTYGLSYMDNYPDSKLERGIFLHFKVKALKKIARIDYQAYQGIGTGSLVQKIEAGSVAGKNILCGFWFKLFRDLMPSVAFSIFFISRISLPIMYAVLIGYAVVFLISNFLLKALYKIQETILDNEEKLNRFLVRGFMEMIVFRVNKRFKKEIKKADIAKNKLVQSKVKMTLIHEAFFTIFAILIAIVKVGLIIFAWQTKSISVGAVVALVSLLDNAYTPIAIFNVEFIEYKLDKSAFERYQKFLSEPDDEMLMLGERIDNCKGDICLSNLSFEYGNRKILQHISLRIKQGEKIALVGESGAGKSTLVKLLLGLLKPSFGNIGIGNHDLSKLCLNSYYEHISYIPQESPVFDGSLRENLVFDKKIADNEIAQVLEKVSLSKLTSSLANGMDTEIGERGVMLSGGERQRLALARLWFSNPDIIILDEATSAMDSVTEADVFQETINHLDGKTVITIAHRLSTIKNFDLIIVLRNGEIAGSGSFVELMNENEYFQTLYKTSLTDNN